MAAWLRGKVRQRVSVCVGKRERAKKTHTEPSFNVPRFALNMHSLRILTALALLAFATAATGDALTEAARRSVVVQVRRKHGRAEPMPVFAGAGGGSKPSSPLPTWQFVTHCP